MASARGLAWWLAPGADRSARQSAAVTVRRRIAHSDGGVTSPSFSGRGRGGDGREHHTLLRRHHGEARAAAAWRAGRGCGHGGCAAGGGSRQGGARPGGQSPAEPPAARGLEAWGGRPAAILEPSALGLPRGAVWGARAAPAGGLRAGRGRGSQPRAWLGPLEVSLSSGSAGGGPGRLLAGCWCFSPVFL